MILIVTSSADEAARSLAGHIAADHEIRLVTCRDLSSAGWRHYVSGGGDQVSTAVADGTVVDVREIRAVLTRIPAIDESELVHIAPRDRSYVASEMTAFLWSWLHSLHCTVINPPTRTSLAGPGWRAEQWLHLANQLGTPVCDVAVGLPPVASTTDIAITSVVGEGCVGDVDESLARHSIRLARAAGVELLEVQFTSRDARAQMVGATPWLDLTRPEVAKAVVDRMTSATC
jgi:hypothetical protein